jgi:uncharacterized SAM-binding protein YcdF (DUF218 family)
VIKVSSSSNELRIIHFLILISPLLLVLMINIISDNYLIFTKISFLLFVFIYLLIAIILIKVFLLDWDMYKNNNSIIFENIFGKKEIIDINLIHNVKIYKTILSVSFYFGIQIDSKIYIVRYFPKRHVFESYINKDKAMKDLKNEFHSSREMKFD